LGVKRTPSWTSAMSLIDPIRTSRIRLAIPSVAVG
jgi:hypothetical protein